MVSTTPHNHQTNQEVLVSCPPSLPLSHTSLSLRLLSLSQNSLSLGPLTSLSQISLSQTSDFSLSQTSLTSLFLRVLSHSDFSLTQTSLSPSLLRLLSLRLLSLGLLSFRLLSLFLKLHFSLRTSLSLRLLSLTQSFLSLSLSDFSFSSFSLRPGKPAIVVLLLYYRLTSLNTRNTHPSRS